MSQPQEQPDQCPLSLQEHVDIVLLAIMMSGLGGLCEGTYQALVEVSEFIRTYKHYSAYTPTMTSAMLEQAKEAEENERLQEAVKHMPVGRG